MINKTQNLKLLNKRISELKLKGKVIIAFDFDELVIPIHLTREITKKYPKPINKIKLEKLGSCSFRGIEYLNSLAVGYNFKEYEKIRNKISKKTKWSKGFKELLRKLAKKYSLIFITSGMKDICESKLKEIRFNSKNIIGGEFAIKNNKILGSKLIISDKDKGVIIQKLKKRGYFVVSVGHSLGDKFMLEKSDLSISFNSKMQNLAQFNTKSPEEIYNIIETQI